MECPNDPKHVGFRIRNLDPRYSTHYAKAVCIVCGGFLQWVDKGNLADVLEMPELHGSIQELFSLALERAAETYHRNREEKGDGWSDPVCSIYFLQGKLIEEAEEFRQAMFEENELDEVLDVIVCGLMLAQRLIERAE